MHFVLHEYFECFHHNLWRFLNDVPQIMENLSIFKPPATCFYLQVVAKFTAYIEELGKNFRRF